MGEVWKGFTARFRPLGDAQQLLRQVRGLGGLGEMV